MIDHSGVLTRILRSYFTPTVLLSHPQTIWKLEYSPDWPVRGIFNFQNNHYRRNSNRNSNDTHAQKYMKTHMFCKHLSYYRRNSNRNSNDTHAQKYMKTYMFCMHLSYYRRNSNRNSNDTHAQKYMKTHMFFSLPQVLPRELKPQLKSNSNAFDCKTYRFCSI